MGWMKNKSVAVVMVIVAIAALGYLYKTQLMPKSVAFDLKAKDGTIFEKVLLSADTKFPIEWQGKKECQPVTKYWDAKAKKVVFLTKDEPVGMELVPGDGTATKPKEK